MGGGEVDCSDRGQWSVADFIRKEVPDWDDEVVATARFKAFSGQRPDWQPRFLFWRDLILKVARHLHLFIVRPSQVKNIWFNRGGLTPLCLDSVLLEMYNAGDVLRTCDLTDPRSGRLSSVFKKVVNLMAFTRLSSQVDIMEDDLILVPLLKDKAAEVIKTITESHWTSSCIVTMKMFTDICGDSKEAYVMLSYLSGCRKAQYFSINKQDFLEGVKVSLSSTAVSTVSTLDFDMLHLISTAQKLQQKLDLLDRRYEISRKLASTSLKTGDKKAALRHLKCSKLASESRENCTTFLRRVEEVLSVISEAESSKKVSEAIQIGTKVMKELRVNPEDIHASLQEFDEMVDSLKEAEIVIESGSSYTRIDDEDVEDEYKKLEIEVGEYSPPIISEIGATTTSVGGTDANDLGNADSWIDGFSRLTVVDDAEARLGEKEMLKELVLESG
ncbi:charged multivesicular body protein 7 [Impatiens glandulifera]|uniref:charged multivesicular body protein 7 n=1 Tax=Impatiens glandulifera TaxID=253017 RepID=UPI001FB169AE|nr:charged multivesicular body protein 7 [Impatiens glandulifera]